VRKLRLDAASFQYERRIEMAKRGNTEGSITYNNKRKRWEAKFSFKDTVTGVLIRKTFVGKTQAEAQEKGKEWRRKLEGGLMLDADITTLGEWIEVWLTEYVRSKGLSPKTVAKYESCLNCYVVPALGRVPMLKLKPVTFQRLFNQLRIDGGRVRKTMIDNKEVSEKRGLSAGTIKTTRRYISMALEKAVEDGMLVKNPVRTTDPIKQSKKEARSLTKEQATVLLATAKNEGRKYYGNYMAILLALATGMRLGELFGLQWSCVDMERGAIHVKRSLITSLAGMNFKEPKTARSIRRIPLTADVLKELKMYKKSQEWAIQNAGEKWSDNDLVLTNSFGKAVETSNFTTRYFKRILVKAKIDRSFKFHELRHTYASFLVQAGVNFKIIQELMGHSSITMTLDTYSHLAPEAKEEAVNKLAGVFTITPLQEEEKGGQ
jgi:integrase